MSLGVIGQAAGLFAVTNIDDILILALFYAQATGRAGAGRRIVIGQYLGFAAILGLAIAAGFGATFLPDSALPYLGLLPLVLGLKAAWQAGKRDGRDDGDDETGAKAAGPGILGVAAVTLANGGDNLGVYVPVFANAGIGGTAVYAAVFLALIAVWCAAGRFFATRPLMARALTRWGHLLLPVVLIGIGLLILIEGGAFGLGH
ncbi:cadmium resistance protein CadD (predicted permease) [Actinocorallia herbida]|uniref:Cadmium resistance protein CadD (Predicted permease) n=1 Tax=Actinocorallia herbida TaxID=58109 RepID=A0A3N1D1X4_9ACTN|nr:cadmium resistance transporter [Actinocorallia herbida]ROO87512.1 cadmium resistance protein CadD (predicted permease) [Actinocorallia herbida]